MKKNTIAFISQLESSQQLAWLEKLQTLLPNESIKLLVDFSKQELLKCEVAIVANPVSEDLCELVNLKWIQSLWAGVEKLVTALQQPILAHLNCNVSRLIDPQLSHTMSEAVLAWVLYLHRDMPRYLAQQRQREWTQQPSVKVEQRKIGVIGLGELGEKSALRLKDNGFTVIGWSRKQKHLAGVECFSGEQGLQAVLAQVDILVCLLPLTAETKHLLNARAFSQMKESASIINFARGGIINHSDLLDALTSNKLNHAVLDVFEQEPLPKESSIWQHPSITVLPHISAPTHFDSASEIVANNIIQYRKTNELPICVDVKVGY